MSTHKTDTKNYGRQFFSGVAALAVSTFIVKIIGMFYKIPMMRYLGAEGMGYFNSAYEIYSFCFVIATTGIPVAVSILISQSFSRGDNEHAQKIYKSALVALGTIGLIGTFILTVFHKQLSLIIKNDGASYSILAVSPSLFMICIISAIRGYFQGRQIMMPTAISQVIEALGKLVLGLGFAIYAISKGYSTPVIASYAVFGLTLGIAASMLYLILFKCFYKQDTGTYSTQRTSSTSEILRELFSIAVPITLSSAILSLSKLIDMGMILVRLGDIGYTQESANSIYGSYSTMAISIYNLPSTLISAIALPLIPILTSAIETRDDQKEQIISATALKMTAMVAIPAGLGISVFSKPILSLLFSTQQREIEYTAPLLSILGISVFLSAMITITNAILQAYKEVKKPIISMIIGTAVKIGLAFYLIGTPEINIYGAPISTLFSLLTIVSLNLYFIVKVNPNVYSVFTLFVKPLIASLISVAVGVFTYIIAQDLINTNALLILAVGEVCLVYLLSVLKLKCIKSDEILMLPAGKKIHKILTQIKLIQ